MSDVRQDVETVRLLRDFAEARDKDVGFSTGMTDVMRAAAARIEELERQLGEAEAAGYAEKRRAEDAEYARDTFHRAGEEALQRIEELERLEKRAWRHAREMGDALDEAREALRRYGDHRAGCEYAEKAPPGVAPCTCGLSAALGEDKLDLDEAAWKPTRLEGPIIAWYDVSTSGGATVSDVRQDVPEIKRCWERVHAVMPASNPSDPNDPSVNLDTLAAIAHAKWRALEDDAARIEELERERDEWKGLTAEWRERCDEARDRIEELERELAEGRRKHLVTLAERDEARGALRRYGDHRAGCEYAEKAPPGVAPCTCGLSAALGEAAD